MKSIGVRLALAFFCVIIFLVAQTLVAGYTSRLITRVETQARERENQLDRLRLTLAQTRLLAYKLIGTLNPLDMDIEKAMYLQQMAKLTPMLEKQGVNKALIERNRTLYEEIIALHYDFSVKRARQLIGQESKEAHEKLMANLDALAHRHRSENQATIKRAHRRAELLNAGLLAAALLTAIFWALILARTVTDRGKAERDLKASQERLSLALSGADLEAWDWDIKNGRIKLSPVWAARLGLKLQDGEVVRQDYLARLDQESLRLVETVVREHLRGTTDHYEEELHIKGGDGRWLWVQARGKVVERDQAGNPLRAAGTHLDITPRKQMEQNLAASRERLSLAVEALDAAIWEFSLPLGREYFVSPRFWQMMGFNETEAPVGLSVWEWGRERIFREDRPPLAEAFQAFSRGQTERIEADFRVRHQDGHWFWMRIRAQASQRDQAGKPTRIIGLGFDVTGRKKARQQKAALQSQLRQAQKMEAVGTLAGGIAHDFNNILGAVMGYAELALEKTRSGRGNQGELASILKAAGRARDLVAQILTFSRKSDSRPAPMDINAVVGQAREILAHALPKMIQVATELTGETRLISADPTQVEQVLLNLATNAADAMPEGGILTISTNNVQLDEEYCRRHLEVLPGPYTLLQISDTGLGMDQATLEQIFDPFFTTKEPGKGTGLGLSSVYGIVKSHGGHIACFSQPGRGTTFRVYFPASPVQELAQVPAPPAMAEEAGGRGQTILLVDDEEALRGIGGEFLEMAGFQVLTAKNGEEALQIFSGNGNRVDLVLLDLSMPGMGGRKCLSELLSLAPSLPIVVASGYSKETTRGEVLAAGAVGFLGKPYSREQLIEAVTAGLGPAAE